MQKGSKNHKSSIKHLNRNNYIRAKEILLINEENENIGVVPTQKALEMAQEAGLDLVEVGPKSQPPVCKIMDYSKYVYEQKKKLRKNKAGRAKALKELRFSAIIADHDLDVKVKRGLEFLSKGHNLRIMIFRKKRQTKEQATEILNKLLTKFQDYSTIEAEPKFEGRRIILTFKSNGAKQNKQNSSKAGKKKQPEGE